MGCGHRPRPPVSSKLDPYKSIIEARLAEYPKVTGWTDPVMGARQKNSRANQPGPPLWSQPPLHQAPHKPSIRRVQTPSEAPGTGRPHGPKFPNTLRPAKQCRWVRHRQRCRPSVQSRTYHRSPPSVVGQRESHWRTPFPPSWPESLPAPQARQLPEYGFRWWRPGLPGPESIPSEKHYAPADHAQLPSPIQSLVLEPTAVRVLGKATPSGRTA